MNIYAKGKMWKVEGSTAKFKTKEEALAFLASKSNVKKRQKITPSEPAPVVEETDNNWSPVEKLRGFSSVCEECECNPCECEWKSVEETLLETESSMEDHS